MTERELIKYLLNDLKKFKQYEKKFFETLLIEIKNSIDIRGNEYSYKDGENNIVILRENFPNEDIKRFIDKLLIKFFNEKRIEYTQYSIPELEEIDINDLNYNNICNCKKFQWMKAHIKNFLHNHILKNTSNGNFFDEFSNIVSINNEIKKFISDSKMKTLRAKYLYNFFYNKENYTYVEKNCKEKIEKDIENVDILLISEKIFKKGKYNEVLDKYKKIKFVKCKFDNVDTKYLLTNKNGELTFEKCKLIGQFNHIFSKSIIFDTCPIINEYSHSNVSEDKVEINKLLFTNCKINKLELEGVTLNYQLFKNTNQMSDNYKKIDLLRLKNCEIKKNFIIDIENREDAKKYKRFEITKLDLTNTVFKPNTKDKAKVKIQFCDIDIGIFYNTSFHDLIDFYQTKFRKKVNFERADFFDISVFSEAIFDCNVNFNYVKFFGKAIFRDTVITKTLNLRNTIFDDEANFLDISKHNRKDDDGKFIGEPSDIDVENRETARVIKNFYDNSNNIIEANRFYKLEMIEREDELKENKSKHLFEWAIFKAHGLTSNHSQDWKLAFLWIMIFGLFSSFYELIIHDKMVEPANDIFIGILIYGFLCFYLYLLLESKNFNKYLGLISFWSVSFILYGLCTNDFYLTEFAKNLNPFSIMKNGEEITFIGLVFKIIIAYLIYQLIISIRQNTRRK